MLIELSCFLFEGVDCRSFGFAPCFVINRMASQDRQDKFCGNDRRQVLKRYEIAAEAPPKKSTYNRGTHPNIE